MSLRKLNLRWAWVLPLSFAASVCVGESLTGTLYSQHGGSANNATVTVEIAVEGQIYELRSAERLLSGFKDGLCRDIGAIWTVEFTRQQNSRLVMTKAVCEGEVDTPVHDAWLLVTNHLRNRAPRIRPALEVMSVQWRSSEAFSDYEMRVRDVKFTDYLRSKGRCLDVQAADSSRIEMTTSADCHLWFENKPVNLQFSIATNRMEQDPEIDEIKFVGAR